MALALMGNIAASTRTPDLNRGRELFVTCAVILKQLTDCRDDRRWNLRIEKVLYQRHLTEPADFADIAGYACQLPRHVTRNVGEGNAARLTPRRGGQHYAYLVRQIRFAGDRRRPNMAAMHERTIRKFSLTP